MTDAPGGTNMRRKSTMKRRRCDIRQSDPYLVTTKRAAELLNMTPKTLRLRGKTGEVPGRVRLGPRLVRWSLVALQSWISATATKEKRSKELDISVCQDENASR
jgi:predicted DNA-binding transcriptional regulator AlpA